MIVKRVMINDKANLKKILPVNSLFITRAGQIINMTLFTKEVSVKN